MESIIEIIFNSNIFSLLFQSGLLIIALVIIFGGGYLIYTVYCKHQEKVLELQQKSNEEKYKRENEFKDIAKDFTRIMKDNMDLLKLEKQERQDERDRRNFLCEQHQFRVEKHIVNAKEQIEIVVECENCKKEHKFALNELETALKELNNKF